MYIVEEGLSELGATGFGGFLPCLTFFAGREERLCTISIAEKDFPRNSLRPKFKNLARPTLVIRKVPGPTCSYSGAAFPPPLAP